jgi:ATP-dependent Clp protease protease subunit
MMMHKFWNFSLGEKGERTLFLEGAIAEETWWGDEITPKMFKNDLHSGSGDVVVWINSPGGDVFAAASIYNMLKEYPGKVTVKIDAMAASAASVVAMAGDRVLISPVGHILIHNPSTIAIGDSEEMLRAKSLLDSVKDSIINAYELKTGMPRQKLAHMMDAETDMPAQIAVALGFADEILYQSEGEGNKIQIPVSAAMFSRQTVPNSLLDKMRREEVPEPAPPPAPRVGINAAQRESIISKQ